MMKVREVLQDPLYRGSLVLLLNTAIMSALGFGFWTLAARDYPAATVGSFSGLSSGIGLVSTIASLGLPNMVTRHLVSSESPRGLLVVATMAITALGGFLCVIVLLIFNSFLPASLHLQAHGWSALLFTVLVILTSLNGAWSAALIVLRLPQAVLWTNLAGSVSKLLVLYLLTSMRSSGLVIAFSVGLLISSLTDIPVLAGRTPWGNGISGSFAIFRDYLCVTVNNYAATILGILPTTVMPLEIIAERGPAEAAPFALVSMLTGFLNVIPSTMSQLVFAESSRPGASLDGQVRKAIRGIYGILIPLVLIAMIAAPVILRVFGPTYASEGTSSFRILALTTLAMSGNYLVDSMLIARDRGGAYLFMNGTNAALVLGLVAVFLHRGIIGAAEGWGLAQVISLLLGLIVVGTGQAHGNRDERATAASAEVATPSDELHAGQGRPEEIRRPRIDVPPSVRATVPLMLGSTGGSEELVRGLSSRFTQGPMPRRPKQGFAGPGSVTFFGIWFPPMSIPVGPRQLRRPRELPVLVGFNAYSGWLTALLIPSLHVSDIFAGSWELLRRLGGMPEHAVWDSDYMRPEIRRFFNSIGVNAIPAPRIEESIIRQIYVYIEHKFIAGRVIYSPQQFNEQLMTWTASDNSYSVHTENIPRVLLEAADKQNMTPLPPRPPASVWRIEAYVQDRPFIRFDSNDYAVDPIAIGEKVLVVADLWRVDVYCRARQVGAYRRSWARNLVIGVPRVLRHPQQHAMR